MPARKGGHEVFCGNWENGVDKRCDERYNLSCVCGRSSSGRARPCQGRGSEFEPRRPLQKETPSDRMVFLFGMPRAGLNSLPRPARISGRTAVGFRVGRPALRPPPFIAGAFVCRAAGCGRPALRMSAANRSVGDGVPDVPSARRCRAGNGFPRRFAPRSKCPWGTPRNDRGGVYRHAATIRQDGVSFLTVPGETPASGRAAPPAPRRSAPAGRPGRR